MSSTSELSANNKGRTLETTASYRIGKTIVSIVRIFRTNDAETIAEILMKLMKKEEESP